MISLLLFPPAIVAEHAGRAQARPVVDPAVPAYTSVPVSGRVTIAGSDTMQSVLVRVAREFRHWHPEVQIAIEAERPRPDQSPRSVLEPLLGRQSNSRRGDGQTAGHFGSNEVTILAISRSLTRDEIHEFVERFGYAPTAIPIARDAVAIYVHRDNLIEGLTLEQVDAMFGATRNRGATEDIASWGQLGMGKDWADAPIHLYGRDKRSSGTRPFFKEHVLMGGEFKDRIGEEPGSASVVLAVARDPFGIGYSGIGFQTTAVRAVPLAEKAGRVFIAPSSDAVMNGIYPLSRHLYLYVNKPPDQPLSPIIEELLKFLNSQEGQKAIVSAGGFPLQATQVARNLQLLKGSTGVAGTARSGTLPN
jgi:phosphate transport system substrate-binding protein